VRPPERSSVRRRATAGLILLVEAAVAGYVALLTWLLSAWMVDDSQAFRMERADWYLEGARRFVWAVVVGSLFGAVVYAANRRWVAGLLPGSPRLGGRAAVLCALAIVLSGAAGALYFVTTRPFM
jgi:hypothetical protein